VLLVLKYIVKLGGLNDTYLGGLSSYGLLLLIVAYLQEKNIEEYSTVNYGRLLLEIMKFYSDFNFKDTQVRPRLPDSPSLIPIFSKFSDLNDKVPIIIDPLITTSINNVAKCTYRMNDLQDLFKAVTQSILCDCTCANHKKDEWMLYPYTKELTQFWDNEHSLLNRMFSIAISLSWCNESIK